MTEKKELITNKGIKKKLPLQKLVDQLAKYGGFHLLEPFMDNIHKMNPHHNAIKKKFLADDTAKKERENIRKNLKILDSLLDDSQEIDEIIIQGTQKVDELDEYLIQNKKQALLATKELECAYRGIALFFLNTEEERIRNITIMNASSEQLRDLDNSRFFDTVSEELTNAYDRLDLRDNYGLLVIPGYLGSNKILEKWAKIAYQNKVMLITDFEHLDEPDDVMEMFDAAKLTGGEIYRSNVIMTCNWLLSRGRYNEIEEDDDLYIPPSLALAGKIYKTLMSQVTAGKKYGIINEVMGVRFILKKNEVAILEKLGLIPMVNEYGKVMAFSAKTLFDGDNLGLQTYSVVRVFDYVTKVMMDFLNRRAFENFNTRVRKEILGQIVHFLDSITGSSKLIESFSVKRFEQDHMQKDRIHLDIHMKPFFPAKNFLIKMDGQKKDDGNEWDSEYEQT